MMLVMFAAEESVWTGGLEGQVVAAWPESQMFACTFEAAVATILLLAASCACIS